MSTRVVFNETPHNRNYYIGRCMIIPDSKAHGANMGPIWGRQDPGGPHVGSMNFAIWDVEVLLCMANALHTAGKQTR